MKVKFCCDKKLVNVIPRPVRSVKAAPDYYRETKPQFGAKPDNSTVKRCVPFLDALSAGFVVPLWCDMFVSARDGNLSINFPSGFQQKSTLDSHFIEQLPNHPLSGTPYGKILPKLISPWTVQTSRGVSCLFTSPLNHLERRIKILDGIVDTDAYYHNVNLPFIWTGGDGEFTIEMGTPIVQVIPFRREESSLQFGQTDPEKHSETVARIGKYMNSGYRNEFWHARRKSPLAGWRLILDKIRRVKF